MYRRHYKDPYPHQDHSLRSRSPPERLSRSHYKLTPEDRYKKIPHHLDMHHHSRGKASKLHVYKDLEREPKDTWRHHREYDDPSPQRLRPQSPPHRLHQSHSPSHRAEDRNIRITVGNDQFRSESPDHQLASAHARLGPPVERLYSRAQSCHAPPVSQECSQSLLNDEDSGFEELQMARLRKEMKEEMTRERMKQIMLEDMERRLHVEKCKLRREQSPQSDDEADILRRYQREHCARKTSSGFELAASDYDMNTSCIPGIADFKEALNKPSTEIRNIDDEEHFLYGDDGKYGRQLEKKVAIDRQTVSRSDRYEAEKLMVNKVKEYCTVSAPPSNTFAGNDGKNEQRFEQDLATVLHTLGLNLSLSELTQLIMAKKQNDFPSSHEPISKYIPQQPAPTDHQHQRTPTNIPKQPAPIDHKHQPTPTNIPKQPAPTDHQHQPTPTNIPMQAATPKEPQQYTTCPIYPGYQPPNAFFGNAPVPASSMVPASPSTPAPAPNMASYSAPPMSERHPLGFPWISGMPMPPGHQEYYNVGITPQLPHPQGCLRPTHLLPFRTETENMSILFPSPSVKTTQAQRPNLRVIETVDLDAENVRTLVPIVVHHPLSTPTTPQPSGAVPIKAEEKENLVRETQERQKRLACLEQELKKLRKQQGEVERIKRKEKDGHKDPALLALGLLQKDVAEQIALTRRQVAAAAQRQTELDKTGVPSLDQDAKKPMTIDLTDLEDQKTKEKGILTKNEKKVEKSEGEYFDGGTHWCKLCNSLFVNFHDLFSHLHTKKHRQFEDVLERPWTSMMKSNVVPPFPNCNVKRALSIGILNEGQIARGAEFMMPVKAFYCKLCKEFSGDASCATRHVRSIKHNLEFQKYATKVPNYVFQLNKHRNAAVQVITEDERRRLVEKKRKDYEDSQERKTKLMKIMETEKRQFVELDEIKSDGGTDASSKTQIKLTLRGTDKAKEKVAEGESSKCAATKAEEVNGTQGAKKEAFNSKASKQISINLSGKTLIPPPVTNVPTVMANQPRIRPKLPLLPISQRKPSSLVPQAMQRPVPLNMFLSIGGKHSAKPLPVVTDDRLMQQQQEQQQLQVMMQKQQNNKELKEECKHSAITQVVKEDNKEGSLKIPDINLQTSTENAETAAADNVDKRGLEAEMGGFHEMAAVEKGKEEVQFPLEEETFEEGSAENISSIEIEREQPVAMEIDMTSDKVKKEEEENPEKSCVTDKANTPEECAPGITEVLESVLAIPVPRPSISDEQPVAMEIDITSDKMKKQEEKENPEKSCVGDQANLQEEHASGTTEVLESVLARPALLPLISAEQPVAMKIDLTSDKVEKEEEEENPEKSCVTDKANTQEECAPGTTEVLESVLARPALLPLISAEQPVAMKIDLTSDKVEKEEEEENPEKCCVIDKANTQEECAPGTTEVLESVMVIPVPPRPILVAQPMMTRRQTLLASANAQELHDIFYSGTNVERKASAPSAANPCVVSKMPSLSSDDIGTEEQAKSEDPDTSPSSKEES
uniref:zinc finger protein 318-like n=1 Tax=Myxine glutinosa TaxID=7769 RepID=UPI003590263E